jgi:hypothetical protein
MEGLEYIMPRVQLRDKNDALMDAYHDIYVLRLIHVVLQTLATVPAEAPSLLRAALQK